MKFKVKEYDAEGQYHVCTDENGDDFKIDILVDGSLSDHWGRNPDQLIGRTVDVEDTHAYISIANGVKLLDCRTHKAPEGECGTCDEARKTGNEFHPPHEPSKNCESGSHEHCSCGNCF